MTLIVWDLKVIIKIKMQIIREASRFKINKLKYLRMKVRLSKRSWIQVSNKKK